MSQVEFYRCDVCGNLVALVNKGGGTQVCCDQEMTQLVPNTVDASKEKHVPHVTREDGKIKVAVGSTLHPMVPEHYIMWIAIVSGDRLEFRYLKPGEEPIAVFDGVETGTAYEYCNLHGLWKADF
ncbi:MAG: desulfoferrodoxin FeS4 iron-binding domain-containing protein [Clostridiaceae bacterium]|jgi:superoxide reductase|nr:desulfoferrodoxin FeS4 iron-binding domain-containing protein [Clostridiaceae bacterium]